MKIHNGFYLKKTKNKNGWLKNRIHENCGHYVATTFL